MERQDVDSTHRMMPLRTFTDPLSNEIDSQRNSEAQSSVAKIHKNDEPKSIKFGFASNIVFWKMAAFGVILGALTGLLGLGFNNIIVEVLFTILRFIVIRELDSHQMGR